MNEIIAVTLCFSVVSVVANIAQKHFGFSYEKYWWLHISLILLGIIGVHAFTGLFNSPYLLNSTGVTIGFITALAFIALELLRGKYIGKEKYFGGETLGGAYGGLLSPQLSGVSVKTIEIFFQDFVLLAIIIALLQMYPVPITSFLIALIVLLVHLPGIYFLGRVYGTIFTTLATIFSLSAPSLVESASIAFYLIFSVHLLMYPFIMFLCKLYQSRVVRL